MSRASVNQKCLISPETTPGIPVFPTRDLPALSIEQGRRLTNQFYRQMGKKYFTSGVRHREWSEGNYAGPLDFNEIVYILSGIYGAPTPAQIGATAGYTWAFNPQTSQEDVLKTFTVKYGDTVAAEMAAHLVFNSLQIECTQEDCRVSGETFAYALDNTVSPLVYNASDVVLTDEVQKVAITGSPTGGTFTLTWDSQTTGAIAYNATKAQVKAALQALSNLADDDVEVYGGQLPANPVYVWFKGAQKATDVAAMTATGSLTGGSSPAVAITTEQAGAATTTAIEQQPVSLSQFDFYLDSAYANIGTTKRCETLEFRLNVPAKRERVTVLCTDYPSFKDTVENPLEGATGQLVLVYDSAIVTLLNAMNQASKPTYFLRGIAVGANIGASADYTFQVDLAVKLAQPTERRNVGGVYAMEFNFQVVHDATMGGAADFSIVSTRSAL